MTHTAWFYVVGVSGAVPSFSIKIISQTECFFFQHCSVLIPYSSLEEFFSWSEFIISSREARLASVVLASCKIGHAPYFLLLIYLLSSSLTSYTWCHGAFRVSRQHGAVSCFIHEELILRIFTTLLAVNHEQFLVEMTHKSKPDDNAGFSKWLEILAGEDFPPKLALGWESRLEIHNGSNGEKDDNKKPAEQRENRLAQRR